MAKAREDVQRAMERQRLAEEDLNQAEKEEWLKDFREHGGVDNPNPQ